MFVNVMYSSWYRLGVQGVHELLCFINPLNIYIAYDNCRDNNSNTYYTKYGSKLFSFLVFLVIFAQNRIVEILHKHPRAIQNSVFFTYDNKFLTVICFYMYTKKAA